MTLQQATLGILIASSLGLMGCKDLSGELTLSQELRSTKIVRKLFKTKKSPQKLAAGRYEAAIDVKSGGDKAEIQIYAGGDKIQEIKINIPDHKKIPRNGELRLSSKEMGQPFDLVLGVRTAVEESGIYRDHESCTYTYYVEECSYSPPHGRVCRSVPVTRHGYQYVEYYYRTTHTSARVLIMQDQVEKGQFYGNRTDRDRVITYSTSCR